MRDSHRGILRELHRASRSCQAAARSDRNCQEFGMSIWPTTETDMISSCYISIQVDDHDDENNIILLLFGSQLPVARRGITRFSPQEEAPVAQHPQICLFSRQSNTHSNFSSWTRLKSLFTNVRRCLTPKTGASRSLKINHFAAHHRIMRITQIESNQATELGYS